MFNVILTVLSYHRFNDEESDYRFSRTYDQFRHDIDKKCYDWITIDDGRSCMIRACDMLRQRNVRAKLFICTSLIGQKNYCTWDQIRQLAKFHDIENHSHIHKWHSGMAQHEIYESMVTAQDLIIKNIGRKPRYFVPPYNDFDDRVLDIANDLELVLVKDRTNILNISK